jgi:MinD superfamily P-loop ATPase
MKQLAVISGKGGTGKTSLVASFAALAQRTVLADCDVDAADLHLVVQPSLVSREHYSGGRRALIDGGRCADCGTCADLCRFDAIESIQGASVTDSTGPTVDPIACEGCGVCAWFCPEHAIGLVDRIDGEWFLSETRFGPMVHARLGAGGESSGKLVSILRSAARGVANERNIDVVIIDGSPGIGCPVIASITGADLILVVTEPTLSGLHDLGRVIRLGHHFGIPTLSVVNRFDLNEVNTRRIERCAGELGAVIAGRVRLDPAVTRAQVQGMSVVEFTNSGAAADITELWRIVQHKLTGRELPVDETSKERHAAVR